jgi:hypothetical protein
MISLHYLKTCVLDDQTLLFKSIEEVEGVDYTDEIEEFKNDLDKCTCLEQVVDVLTERGYDTPNAYEYLFTFVIE